MLNYKQSLGFGYFVGSGAILTDTTKTTADLVPLQIGLFNAKNYKPIAVGTGINTVPEIIVAMGSPNEEKISWTNAASSIKSVPIRGSRLISYRKATPKKALNHKVAIGWDGTSDCKTITALCDKTYSLNLQVEGSPTTRFFGPKPLTQTYVYNTGCCTDCFSGCNADVEAMVDYFVTQINSDPRISPFIEASKIVSYTSQTPVYTVECPSYTLTIADEGGVQDLAAVQLAYPGTTVTRKSRSGIFSTYEMVACGGGAPADYVPTVTSPTVDCGCPSGYVYVAPEDKYKITLVDNGIDASGILIGASGITSAIKIGTESIYVGVYLVQAAQGSTIVLAGATIEFLGTTEACCEYSGVCPPAVWTAGPVYYRSSRTMCLTVGDEVCPSGEGSQLTNIADFYANDATVIVESLTQINDGKCANSYSIVQLSKNVLLSGCTDDIAEFDAIIPYEGHNWEACCVEPSANVIDKIGIVLTGAYVDTKFSRCSFKYDDFVELDLPRIYVRQGDYVALEEGKCADAWPVTLLQAPQYPTGLGEFVLRDYIETMQFKGQRWSDDPRWREVYGYNYDFIKTNKQYKQYYLEFEALDKANVNIPYGNDMKTTIIFAFEECTDTTQFEALLEGWIQSARPDLLDADYHDNLYR